MTGIGSHLALHGFFGSGGDWQDVCVHAGIGLPNLATPDLPGHGRLAELPRDHRLYRLEPLLHWLRARLAALPARPRTVIGYSMGGRIALQLAHRFPESLDRLVLIGAGTGIERPEERAARRQIDQARAERILQIGAAAFHREWIATPLLASRQKTPPELQERLRSRREAAHPIGLAAAIVAFSPGSLPAIPPDTLRFRGPILLLSGLSDHQYTESNTRFSEKHPGSTATKIPDTGHAPHFEAPTTTLARISDFSGQSRSIFREQRDD